MPPQQPKGLGKEVVITIIVPPGAKITSKKRTKKKTAKKRSKKQ